MSLFVHLFHILFVGGLFLYVGILKTKTYPPVFVLCFWLGILIILYHSVKLFIKWKGGKSFWVNLIHIFIIGPLLIYIGYEKEKTSRKYFEILLMLAFASIGYHLYYLIL